MMRALFHGVASGMVVGAWLALSTGAVANGTKDETYSYEIAWGRVPLAELQLHRRESPAGYNFVGTGELVGPFSALYSWRGRAITSGQIEDGRHLPAVHSWEGTYGGNTRTAEVTWVTPAAAPNAVIVPPPEKGEYTPVAATSLDATVDPLTAIIRLLNRVEFEDRCGGNERVYDGRRRYDLGTRALGPSTIEADREWTYGGETVACRIEYERIGGFPIPDADDDKGPATSTVAIVHLAPIGQDGGWRPVRLETETRLGLVTARVRL